MRFKLQAASNKRQACDNMSCFFMHRNNYTGHTTKGEIYGKTNKKNLPRWYRGVALSTKRGQNSVRKRLYLEYVYRGQGPQRQDASKICGGAKTSGARLIRKFNCKKRLTHLLNSCSPGASWGCGILPRVTMSQEKAESRKLQASSSKRQATSCQLQAGLVRKLLGCDKLSRVIMSLCHKDSRCKRQASSPKQQASSCKPRAASSLIFFPS
jgi:hypothetical protein